MSGGSAIHAGAVLIGAKAILILGPSGSGKSRLAWAILQAADDGRLRFARLVADDQAYVEARHGRLLVRPAPALAGLLEMRGVGIRRLPYEPVAAVGLAVTLGITDPDRMPPAEAETITLNGIQMPHIACKAEIDPLPLIVSRLRTTPHAD